MGLFTRCGQDMGKPQEALHCPDLTATGIMAFLGAEERGDGEDIGTCGQEAVKAGQPDGMGS